MKRFGYRPALRRRGRGDRQHGRPDHAAGDGRGRLHHGRDDRRPLCRDRARRRSSRPILYFAHGVLDGASRSRQARPARHAGRSVPERAGRRCAATGIWSCPWRRWSGCCSAATRRCSPARSGLALTAMRDPRRTASRGRSAVAACASLFWVGARPRRVGASCATASMPSSPIVALLVGACCAGRGRPGHAAPLPRQPRRWRPPRFAGRCRLRVRRHDHRLADAHRRRPRTSPATSSTSATAACSCRLVLTMIACLVLGTGIPTIPSYIITAAIAGPALLELGVPLIVSHMFVFYFGIMADLTPPVALAALRRRADRRRLAHEDRLRGHAHRDCRLCRAVHGRLCAGPHAAERRQPRGLDRPDPRRRLRVRQGGDRHRALGRRRHRLPARTADLARARSSPSWRPASSSSALPLTDEIGFVLTGLFVAWHWRRVRSPAADPA